MSVSDCRLTQKHCGPGVTWLTAEVKNNGDGELSNDIPNCCFELSSVTITTLKTSTHVDQTSSLAHLSSQTPQDYGSGFLPNYSKDAGVLKFAIILYCIQDDIPQIRQHMARRRNCLNYHSPKFNSHLLQLCLGYC